MEEYVTRRGTRVRHGENVRIQVDALQETIRGGTLRRAETPKLDAVTEALLKGVATGQEIVLQDALSLIPAPLSQRRGDISEPAELDVDVSEHEHAALLVEKDGVYEWRLPEETKREVRLRSRDARGSRTLRFRLPGGASGKSAPEGAGRRGLIGLVAGEIAERLRVYVIKFLARATVAETARFLERNVTPGLIAITDDDPDHWRATHSVSPVSPAGSGPARLLLLIHGTFSSTSGGFGALGLTPEGKAFLQKARQRYNAVLAYDHATLSESPDDNARAILAALKALSPPPGTTLDIVAHSRGGLVARYLVERLLAEERIAKAEKVVFVGATNGGTALADRTNWKALLDLYTNLAVAAGRGLMAFDAGVASGIITESVKTLGSFVQAVVDAGVTEDMTPGLAAMSPSGKFVTELNASSPGADDGAARYFVIGSNFDAHLFNRDDRERSLPKKLMQAIADFGADSLMRKMNDLVVDNEAMAQFGGRASRLANSLFWDSNAVIYHTNYFALPDVAKALSVWLLESGAAAAPLMVSEPPVIPTTVSVKQAREILNLLPKEQVVVLGRLGPDSGFYARTAGKIIFDLVKNDDDDTLLTALDLRESNRAEIRSGKEPPPSKIGANGWVRVEDGKVTEATPPPFVPSPHVTVLLSPSLDAFSEKLVAKRRQLPIEPQSNRTSALARQAEIERSAEVRCHFGAEMPASCALSKPAELTVTVSREKLERVLGPASAVAEAIVRLREAIVIEVDPKANCRVVGDASEEIRVPDPGKPEHYDFRIEGLLPGPAELWVYARQGRRRLALIVLQPVFVEAEMLKAKAFADTTKSQLPLVQLRIYENAEGNQSESKLRFVMESQDLDILIDADITLPAAKDDYVTDLYKQLEGKWGENSRDFESFMLGLRAFGAGLYNKIVPEPVRRKLWEHRNNIGAIQVISHEPFIPWEVLHIVEPGETLSSDGNIFLAELGLVRWIANRGWPPASLRIAKGRARHLIPTYLDKRYELQGADEERRLLVEFFGSQEVSSNKLALVKLLETPDAFDLLHVACHGNASQNRIWDASLLLSAGTESDADAMIFLSTSDVEAYGKLGSLSIRGPIIFLNACQVGKTGQTLSGAGGMAHEFAKKGAGLVVASMWSIGDVSAMTFARTFYERLKEGNNVSDATRAARKEAKRSNEPTWLAYSVYGHPYARLSDDAK